MKGIEGLPLKYLVIILVAALVIMVAYTVVSSFSATAIGGAADLNQTVSVGMEKSNKNTCEQMGCSWNETAGTGNKCKC